MKQRARLRLTHRGYLLQRGLMATKIAKSHEKGADEVRESNTTFLWMFVVLTIGIFAWRAGSALD
jgi:hypothetical protein